MVTIPRKLTHDDLWRFKDMGRVAVSPDGRRVAFVQGTSDKEEGEYHSTLMLLHLDEHGQALGEPRKLTSGMKLDAYPAWAPDSRRLLFTSNREGTQSQLWLIDTDGGEARQLTKMFNGVNEAAWSPDGNWIAFTSSAAATEDDEVLMGRKVLDGAAKKRHDDEESFGLRTITTIWYRQDGRGPMEKFSHLFVMSAPVGDAPVEAAAIRRLTTGNFDHIQPAWTPDSLEIGVLCNRAEDRDRSFVSDLWAIHRATGEARCLTDGSLALQSYAWSPDGLQVALVGTQDIRKAGHDLVRLYLVSHAGGEMRMLMPDIDSDAAPTAPAPMGPPAPYVPQWSEDGQRIYLLVTEHGRTNVCMLDVAQDTLKPITTGEQLVLFLRLLPGEHGLVLAHSEPLHPWELSYLSLQNGGVGELKRLSHIHDRLLSEFLWSKPERLQYAGSNGDLIDGWLIRPIGAREGVRYPLLVQIHGGPQSAYGVGMNHIHQYYATQGYAVFYCNPHGSTSCGLKFVRQVEGDWGGWDYQDIMLGVDECIKLGVADPERMVVTGYSYGGYMSMFIIGQTDRFKAAVPMAGVSNLSSFVGTSDVGFWMAIQSKGYPWDPERASYYRERSPLTYAPRVTTPTLLLHPENDLRCPIGQTEEFYAALKMIGKVPVEFVRVPKAWHIGATRAGAQYIRTEKSLEWFGKYVEIRPEEYD